MALALGDTTVIADVTEMLSSLLTGLDVTQDSPAELRGSGNEWAKINLYLYQALENPYAKNQPWVTSDSSSDQQSYPPWPLIFIICSRLMRPMQKRPQCIGACHEVVP